MATAPERASTDRRLHAGAVSSFAVIALLYVVGTVVHVRARAPIWPDVVLNFALAAFPVVGLLIAVRRPRNRVAWLCLGIGLVWAVELVVIAGVAHEAVRPGLVPRPDLLLALGLPLWIPGFLLIGTFLLLVFPDGSLPSPRWRPVAWTSGVLIGVLYLLFALEPATYDDYGFPGVVNPLAVEQLRGHPVFELLVALTPILVVVSAVGLFRRYRRSDGVERLQLKWLVAAVALFAVVYLLVVAAALVVTIRGGDDQAVIDIGIMAGSSFGLIAMSIGVAVTRYRLFEIDRLISRTVTYGLVVAVLAGVYLTGVLVLGDLLPAQSQFGVAGSTLAVAALFNPLRRRVQRSVEQRFNRSRYDAERELDRFAGRLRDELDLDSLTDDLLDVVATTLQPTRADVWLRRNDR
ncbi:hypothetical protein [Nitriliruptor alkaliphilus]|uniref:hypothetical protein n=1 Tax=Nitriliruptor alkaliphilus TaxID=427918 RepID=UPI000698A036|nr:hypothetical protein [Nitriliruptor alkaliphilus]